MEADVKGDIYEGLLSEMLRIPRAVQDSISPRPLIRAIVECVRPGAWENHM